MARDAIERLVNYDEWFVGEVERGLSQIERGEVLADEVVPAKLRYVVAARLEKQLTQKQPHLDEIPAHATRRRGTIVDLEPSLLIRRLAPVRCVQAPKHREN